ncbi:hypothetical protein NE236_29555 [Actinoallomurus purpureus]|uniref:VOC family protein n=1 Tax=Actinoallomurus purpureus TaxID=478114 RepID=UPI002092ABAE|nr:VOC family protein [Actinoallomurus purpureus]MCO6009126.1 hypothetical protein [Actinoallomurus purpureus]
MTAIAGLLPVTLDCGEPRELAAFYRRFVGGGAVVLDHQPGGDRFRVFADPAGHLFCLCRREAATVPIDRP